MLGSSPVSSRSIVSTHPLSQRGNDPLSDDPVHINPRSNDQLTNAAEAGARLLRAVRANEPEATNNVLIAYPGAIGWQDANGNTALHAAIAPQCHPELVYLLLRHSADPAIVNGHGDTSMHLLLAARPTQPVLIERMLDRGKWRGNGRGLSALLLANQDGKTALDLARQADGKPAAGYERIL